MPPGTCKNRIPYAFFLWGAHGGVNSTNKVNAAFLLGGGGRGVPIHIRLTFGLVDPPVGKTKKNAAVCIVFLVQLLSPSIKFESVLCEF